MALRSSSWRISGFSVISLLCISYVFSCSMPQGENYRPPTVGELVINSDVVLYGKVLQTYPDRNFNMMGGNAYTAEMEVYCTLKGGPLQRIVNISEAGVIPGHCVDKQLLVGKDYIVLLAQYSDIFTPFDESPREASEEIVDQITHLCGLQTAYPTGVDPGSATKECPAVAQEGTCYRPPPTADPPIPQEPCHGNGLTVYQNGDTWVEGDCERMCSCMNGEIKCATSCPPAVSPEPSPSCPEPHFDKIEGVCCPKLVCHADIHAPTPATTLVEIPEITTTPKPTDKNEKEVTPGNVTDGAASSHQFMSTLIFGCLLMLALEIA